MSTPARANIEDLYELSPLQQGMLFHHLREPEGGAYIEQTRFRLEGGLNVDAFVRAWQGAVDRHPALRSGFHWEGLDQPMQMVLRKAALPVAQLDWGAKPAGVQLADLEAWLRQDQAQGFDLGKAPLMRLTLIALGGGSWQVVWSYSHLLLDGWCLPMIFREVAGAYAARSAGQVVPAPMAPPYKAFILWLRRREPKWAEAFWRAELAGFSEPTRLPVALRTEAVASEGRVASVESRAVFSPDETLRLLSWCRNHALTPNTLCQGAWALVLGRMGGGADVLFGSTVAGRPADLPGVESTVGLFINTLPARVPLPEATPVSSWLARLQERTSAARQHEHSPLVDVQGWSEVPRSRPLFETLFVFENYPLGEAIAALPAGLKVTEVEAYERTHYPLTVVAAPGTELIVRFLGDGRRVTRADTQTLAERFRMAVHAIMGGAERPLGEIHLLAPEERLALTGPAAPVAPADLVTQIEQHAAQRADWPALRFEGIDVTYGQLADRMSRVARRLGEAGAGPDVVIALCLERSLDLPTAALAVLRSGAAYLPLDPVYPQTRLDFMLADSGAALLIVGRVHATKFAGTPVRTLIWEDLVASASAARPAAPRVGSPDNLAYVIYTSGSTGRPKGVMISRASLGALASLQQAAFPFGRGERVLQFSASSFDASVFEMSHALGGGAQLVLASRDALMPGEPLATTLREERIAYAVLPPSAAAHLPAENLPDLRMLLVAGEACRPELVSRWAGGRVFVNAYGPTENTVVATWAVLSAGATVLPIGTAVAGTAAYVLDASGRPVPAGVPGELCLAGVSLARGYLRRPDLTAERFLPDAWSGLPGARLYRTGDRVWRDEAGQLHYLGRFDGQVKLRGFRIELGEIEAVLASHPAVRETAVAVRAVEGGEGELTAWVVAREGAEVSLRALRAWLAERLPDHFIPGAWMQLPALPVSAGGKVDPSALPSPGRTDDGGDSRPAASPLVELVRLTFAEVLGVSAVKVDDSFFERGGHSLLATKLVSRLRERAATDLPLRAVFDAPTPLALAARLAAARGTPPSPPIAVRAAGTPVPASLGQQRFWLLERLNPGASGNVIQFAVRLRGALDRLRLEAALLALAGRHEPLRIRLVEREGRLLQEAATDGASRLLAATEDGGAAADAAAVSDLGRGPLWRVRLLEVGEQVHQLMFTFHHAIFDGWSEGVLVTELGALYAGTAGPVPAVGYSDFAVWQRARLTDVLAAQVTAVADEVRGVPALELPLDWPRPAVQTFRGALVTREISAATTAPLGALGRREGATLFMTLLAAWEVWLWRHTGQTDFAVGSPVAGRTQPELEPLIGLFVNTLVLRADVSPELDFPALVRRVRARTLRAYDRQEAPFEQVVEAVNPERTVSRPPLFQVLFTVQNMPRAVFAEESLQVEPVEVPVTRSKFDLSLFVIERAEGGLGLSLEYNRDLFEPATAERFLARYATLLAAIAVAPKSRVDALSWIGDDEREMLAGWSAATRPYPSGPWVHRSAETQPAGAPAIVFAGVTVSYAEFGARTTRLAAILQACGVGPEVLVGVYLERSVDLVVALHAVMRAGGAYVPLDPGYPADRIAHMLADADAPVVITTKALAARLPDNRAQRILVDGTEAGSAVASEPALFGGSAAYMIFTSGSTGRPKGAINSHAAILNRLQWMQEALPLTPADRVLQKTPFSFDVSVWEFFWPFMAGSTLVVAEPEAHKDPAHLIELICKHGITTIHFVPSMLRVFLASPGVERCVSLRKVICSGEELPRESVRLCLEKLPAAAMHNLYGPTEAAVDVTWHACLREEEGPVPIGRPIMNIEVRVFDDRMQAQPIGVAGELYLGGVGLGRGYHGRPDLTAERWVPHPLHPGERLYRTGDLARWSAAGELEYLGRTDFQIKLRGFRIELGEIESSLREHPAVSDAAVALRRDRGDARLVGYVVRRIEVSEATLRSALQARLPDHMVPSAWMFLEALPLTPSGKTDRKALPEPAAPAAPTGGEPPEGPVETLVAGLFAELTGAAAPGRSDNFFVLGGHSLLATQLVSRLREQLQVEVPLMHFFADPTPAGCARALVAVETVPGRVEQMARARLRLKAMSPEEKARLAATLRA